MQNEADLIARRVEREEELMARAGSAGRAPKNWAVLIGALLMFGLFFTQLASLRTGAEALRVSLAAAAPELEGVWSPEAVESLAGDLVLLVGSGLAGIFLVLLGLWLQSHARISALHELLDRAGSLRRRAENG